MKTSSDRQIVAVFTKSGSPNLMAMSEFCACAVQNWHKTQNDCVKLQCIRNCQILANVNSSSRSLYVISGPSVVCRLSVVCLSSVCRLSSVTLVHPTQAIEIFGNISTPCGTLAIYDLRIKILRRSSQGNPSVGGVKHKRGRRI